MWEAVTRELILGLVLVNVLLVGIILAHRFLRRRVSALQSERGMRWGTAIAKIVTEGQIPSRVPVWQGEWDIAAATEAILAQWERADPERKDLLKSLFRVWGLFDEHRERLERGNRWDRARSALVLSRLRFAEVRDLLAAQLASAIGATQSILINALALLARPESCPALVEFLAKHGPRRRHTVLAALNACGQHEPQILLPHLDHDDPLVREVIAEALAPFVDAEFLPALTVAAGDTEPEVRAKVARCLLRIRDSRTLPVLRKLAADPVWFVRVQAANALAWCESGEVEDLLIGLICDSDWRVRGKAALALYRRIPDALTILRTLQARVDDRYALEAVVAALERDGVLWRTVEELADPDPSKRERSRALVTELLHIRRFACALYALEGHPREEVRRAVLAIVLEQGQEPELTDQLRTLLDSRRLDAVTRTAITGMIHRQEN